MICPRLHSWQRQFLNGGEKIKFFLLYRITFSRQCVRYWSFFGAGDSDNKLTFFFTASKHKVIIRIVHLIRTIIKLC